MLDLVLTEHFKVIGYNYFRWLVVVYCILISQHNLTIVNNHPFKWDVMVITSTSTTYYNNSCQPMLKYYYIFSQNPSKARSGLETRALLYAWGRQRQWCVVVGAHNVVVSALAQYQLGATQWCACAHAILTAVNDSYINASTCPHAPQRYWFGLLKSGCVLVTWFVFVCQPGHLADDISCSS